MEKNEPKEIKKLQNCLFVLLIEINKIKIEIP